MKYMIGGLSQRHKPIRTCLVISVLIAVLLGSVSVFQPAAPVLADSVAPTAPVPIREETQSVYFPETGHYVPAVFHQFWSSHGGLRAFGYPLTEAFEERSATDGETYLTQYFERARFELHSEFAGTEFEVELGHLGLDILASPALRAPVTPFNSTPSSRYFGETGHSLSNGFKSFWEQNGGVRVFGYPVTEELTANGMTVQYFERARFEYHPENEGTPYTVLPTLLGRGLLTIRGWALPEVVTAGLSPAAVRQGDTTTVRVNYWKPGAVSMEYAGDNLPVSRYNDGVFSVAGVESWADTGVRPVTVNVTDQTGTVRSFDLRLSIVDRAFPQQYLTLPDDRQGLLDPSLVAREWARMKATYEETTTVKYWDRQFIMPVNGEVTTEFGSERSYNGGPISESHSAIDLATDEGTPVKSDAPGRVVLADPLVVRGNTVVVDHGMGVHSAYFHLSSIDVKVGDMVQQGQVIGKVGNTGLSTGSHLHWEIRIGAIGVDPMQWVGQPIP